MASFAHALTYSAILISKVRFRALFAIKSQQMQIKNERFHYRVTHNGFLLKINRNIFFKRQKELHYKLIYVYRIHIYLLKIGYVSFIAINSTKTLGLVWSSNGHTYPILALPRVMNLHTWKIRLIEPRLSPNNAKPPTKLNKKPKPTPHKPAKITPNKCISFCQTSSLSPTSHHHHLFFLKGDNETEMKSRNEDGQLEESLLYKTLQSVQLLVKITTNPPLWLFTNPRFR